MDDKDVMIAELRALVADLMARIAELELALAKANKDSSTSSKPPSSDITQPQPKTKPGRRQKRTRGGQPGHERQLREPLPPERVDETLDYVIRDEDVKRLGLTPTGEFEVIQRIELPEVPIHVADHRLAVYRDAKGDRYLPDVPELEGPIFGPRMLAMIAWLKSVGHLSYSTIETWMEDVLKVPVSRGYLAKLCTGIISDSLADAYNEVLEAIPRQDQLASDETHLKDNGVKYWIWCISSSAFSVFYIARSRSRAVLEKLVGADFLGYLNLDYFSANCSFAWDYWIKAQYCWAHLIRDIKFLKEKHPDEETNAWAEQLLERTRRLFSAWHRREERSAEGFQRSMLTHRDRFLELVRNPPSSKAAANLAARFQVVEYMTADSPAPQLYDLSQDYFRFIFAEGVEPTNNHSEQQIRHCVIDRKITQGTRSEAGRNYHERLWTAIATCKKQSRSIYAFLLESLQAKLNNRPTPSLLNT